VGWWQLDVQERREQPAPPRTLLDLDTDERSSTAAAVRETD
jgi:hypothetical protein